MQRASEERVALVTAECSDEKKISQEDDEKKHKNISVFPYLRSSRILFLQETSREGALQTLVEKMALEGVVPCKEKFLRALIERERLVSTGIGMGVAIPHAKMGDFSDFFIAIGIQKKRGIGWKSLDRAPVRLIFMIGGPDRKQSEYLHILSGLTSAIKQESIRKKMLQSSSSEEILNLFQKF